METKEDTGTVLTVGGALVPLLAEQMRLRAAQAEVHADQAAVLAEYTARQDAVDALIADVSTMETKSPEEQ